MDPLSISGLHASVPYFHHQPQYANTMQSVDHDSLFSSRVSNLYSSKDLLHRKALLAHLRRLKALLTNNIHRNNINQEIAQFKLSLHSVQHHLNVKQSKHNSFTSSSLVQSPTTTQPFQIKQSSNAILPNKTKAYNFINYHQVSKVSCSHPTNAQFLSSITSSSSSTKEQTTNDVTNSPITPVSFTHVPVNNPVLNSDPWTRSSYNQTTYVPPLMAKLYYSTELKALFSHQLKLQSNQRSPTIEQSLEQATNLYNLQLHPTTNSHQVYNLHTIPSSTSCTSLMFKYYDVKPIYPPITTTIQQIIKQKSKNTIPDETSAVQNRTYHGRMTKLDELHAPSALWRQDGTIFFDETDSHTDKKLTTYSHTAYAVSNEYRQHSFYYNQHGVFQNPGTEYGVARNFGFQRRTNYPFRKTYMQPYDKSSAYLSISNDSNVVSKFVSNRVPVDGLSSTLLSLTKSGLHNYGRFFTNDDNFSAQVVKPSNSACMDTVPTYIINQQGRLTPVESSIEDSKEFESDSHS